MKSLIKNCLFIIFLISFSTQLFAMQKNQTVVVFKVEPDDNFPQRDAEKQMMEYFIENFQNEIVQKNIAIASRFDYSDYFNNEYSKTVFKKVDATKQLNKQEKESFDIVTSLGVLHWQKYTKQSQVIQRLADLLKEGGACILQANYKQNEQMPIEQAVYSATKDMNMNVNRENSGFYLSEIKTIEKMFKSAGFKIMKCKKIRIETVFPSKKVFKKFLKNIIINKNKVLDVMSEEQQDSLFENIIKKYDELISKTKYDKYAYGIDGVGILAIKKCENK